MREFDNDLRATLSVAVARVVTSTGAPWDEVSVRYYRRRGFRYWRRLALVTAIKAGGAVVDARTSLRPGQGVVGTAFDTEVVQAVLEGHSMLNTLDELATALGVLGAPPTGWWKAHGR
ncbi:hypothetical protein ACWKSP_14830 [Micromonosporaceae bacterium Da 78-11]